jgi:hypothetical protein
MTQAKRMLGNTGTTLLLDSKVCSAVFSDIGLHGRRTLIEFVQTN